jgi:hypothetical protein
MRFLTKFIFKQALFTSRLVVGIYFLHPILAVLLCLFLAIYTITRMVNGLRIMRSASSSQAIINGAIVIKIMSPSIAWKSAQLGMPQWTKSNTYLVNLLACMARIRIIPIFPIINTAWPWGVWPISS